jgi:hypothetical protein
MGSSSRLRNLDDRVLGRGSVHDRQTRFVFAPIAVLFPVLMLAGLSTVFGARFHNVWFGFAFAAGCALVLVADRAVCGGWYWQRLTRR